MNKICRIGAVVLLLIIVAAITSAAYIHGCSPLDFPTGLTVGGAMILGFAMILVLCHGEKKPSK
jgi:hypothetical protein